MKSYVAGHGRATSIGLPANGRTENRVRVQGERLKALRESLGLTTRDVEEKSQGIAEERHNQEYHISHAWVTDIENGKFTPSIYKLQTLSAIYNRRFTELTSYYGVPVGELSRYRTSIGVPKNASVGHRVRSGDRECVIANAVYKPEFRLEKTNLLARVVEKVGSDPRGFLATSGFA